MTLSREATMIKRYADALWLGNIKDGKGALTSQSKILNDTPYSFVSRFETGTGSNPEELIAAAHAGCFSMMLTNLLTEAKFTATRIETRAEVTLDPSQGKIVSSHLYLKAQVPNISKEQFAEIAKNAEQNCPISKLLNTNISLSYELS